MEPTMAKYTRDFLENAHKGCSSHKDEIIGSELCACFYCQETFTPNEIDEWIEEIIVKGETAICPKCGIDSVLSSKFPILDKQFLSEMNTFWF